MIAARRARRRLALAVLPVMLGAARDPILVSDVSQHEVPLSHGFNGTELMLFGALLTPDGTRAIGPGGAAYDIVVVLKGPTQAITVREKRRLAGIWVNAQSDQLRSAPSFYAVVSSRPIAAIVDDKTAAIYELGLKWLQLSPIGAIDAAEQARFAQGLVGLRQREQLYMQHDGAVRVSGGVLYQARIALPSNLPSGAYTAETFAINRGRVVASTMTDVAVRKTGMEATIADFAQDQALLYGLLTTAIALTMGWAAGRFFPQA